MKIRYVVPELHKNGGIQEFAKSIYAQLIDDFDMQIIDWENDLNLPSKGLLRYLPPRMGVFLFSSILSKHFKNKYKIIDKADLIHFWHPEPAMAFLDKKYIVSCHGMEILRPNVKGFRTILYPLVFKNAILIHANSKFTKNLIIRLFDISAEKIKVINPPIDYKRFAKNISNEEKNKAIVGTLTRFNRRKNIPNIIKALNILKESHDLDFMYYLAGDGLERNKIMQELKGAKFEWQYFGEISDEEKVNRFYPSLDVFVLPPLDLPNDVEGFGIVYLEANAYGIPVVASRTGGVPDAVKEDISGEFADPISPEDIASKILNTLENKDKYLISAKEWAKKFDVKKIANEFAEMYKGVIS